MTDNTISADWFRSLRPSKILMLTLLFATISSALAAWVVTTETDNPLGVQYDILSILVGINLVFLLVLCTLIGRRVILLRRSLREEAIGSRLQRRMVLIFGIVTITPTMIVAVFSAVFFHVGIKSWFDERVRTAIEESVAVAEAYLQEHQDTIRADIIAMRGDLTRDYVLLSTGHNNLTKTINAQVALRNLTEAIIFDKTRVIARSDLSLSLAFERLPDDILMRADAGDVVTLSDNDDKIRALIKLDDVGGLYLLVGRLIDQKVINHMVVAQGAVNEYRRLQEDISGIQLQFSVLFVLVVLLLLLAAIWYGIYTAMRLAVPISRMIVAAEKVRAGDLSVEVSVGNKQDEISELGRTFNRMTGQLRKQREELMRANRQVDKRRRFTEAVFAGVSAGVVALNSKQIITLNNRVAARLLQDDETQSMKGMPITALIPDISQLIADAESHPNQLADKQFTISRKNKRLNLHMRVSVELKDSHIEGYVVTFDDITELVAAQRMAAWSDVARRIAHEIKNPLTPITLSTERLKSKFGSTIENEEEKASFLRYVDTINRHVGDIRQIIEEFVSFARMPTPERSQQDLRITVKEAIFSSRTAYANVKHVLDCPETPVMMAYDARLMGQALTNLLKNAVEALQEKLESEPDLQPQINLKLEHKNDIIQLTIDDNGPGLPDELMEKLTEPYVTTKTKGTGLGLAIVKKQIEEHKGRISLENIVSSGAVTGARVRLTFPQQ